MPTSQDEDVQLPTTACLSVETLRAYEQTLLTEIAAKKRDLLDRMYRPLIRPYLLYRGCQDRLDELSARLQALAEVAPTPAVDTRAALRCHTLLAWRACPLRVSLARCLHLGIAVPFTVTEVSTSEELALLVELRYRPEMTDFTSLRPWIKAVASYDLSTVDDGMAIPIVTGIDVHVNGALATYADVQIPVPQVSKESVDNWLHIERFPIDITSSSLEEIKALHAMAPSILQRSMYPWFIPDIAHAVCEAVQSRQFDRMDLLLSVYAFAKAAFHDQWAHELVPLKLDLPVVTYCIRIEPRLAELEDGDPLREHLQRLCQQARQEYDDVWRRESADVLDAYDEAAARHALAVEHGGALLSDDDAMQSLSLGFTYGRGRLGTEYEPLSRSVVIPAPDSHGRIDRYVREKSSVEDQRPIESKELMAPNAPPGQEMALPLSVALFQEPGQDSIQLPQEDSEIK